MDIVRRCSAWVFERPLWWEKGEGGGRTSNLRFCILTYLEQKISKIFPKWGGIFFMVMNPHGIESLQKSPTKTSPGTSDNPQVLLQTCLKSWMENVRMAFDLIFHPTPSNVNGQCHLSTKMDPRNGRSKGSPIFGPWSEQTTPSGGNHGNFWRGSTKN